MAKNNPYWDKHRHWAVKNRVQVQNPKTGLWVKIDTEKHRFIDNKTSSGKFKWVSDKSKK